MGNLWNTIKTWIDGLLAPKTSHTTVAGPASTISWLVNDYLSMLQVGPIAGTSLVQVRFTTPDPELSAQLANAHASGYVRYGIDLRSQTNEEASTFLQQKLGELKQRYSIPRLP